MELCKGFCELTKEDSLAVEGGVADILIITGLLCGVAIIEYAVTAGVVAMAKDLENCYNNGYNSVKSSVSGGDVK